MTWFTKWAFKNKASVILMVALILVVGAMSYFKLPLEYMPEANMPQVTVTTLGQGQSTGSMVANVTEPIEKAVQNVKHKTEIFSTSGDGFSRVDINFGSGTDMKAAKAEVQEAIADLRFPEGVGKPMLLQLNTSMIPISQISIAFKDGVNKTNMEFLDKKIVPALESVEGVSTVSIYGRAASNVNVTLNKDKMAQLNLPLHTVMGVLQGQTMTAAVAGKAIDGKASNIKVTGSLNGVDALKGLVIAPGVKFGDIATIEAKLDAENVTRVNMHDAMMAVVMKEAGKNAVAVGEGVAKKIEELNKENANLEANVFWASADQVKNSVNSMMKEVGMGALFATIVILLFLRSIRTTLITIVSIPLSLGMTLFMLHQTGITLNILTLGGVAVAVGRLVDDSIVVIENIFRRAQQGEALTREMITQSVKEVGGAITSSTLTTVAVFLPMGLVQGSLHDFMLPFALTVTYALLSSLLVALTVVPLMSKGLLQKASMPKHKEPKRYMNMLRFSLNHKWVPITIAIVLTAGAIGTYLNMPKGAISASDSSMVSMSLEYTSDTPVATVLENGKKLEQTLKDQPEVNMVMMSSGNSADDAKWGEVKPATKVDYFVTIKKGADAQHFIDEMKKQKDNYKGAQFEISTQSMSGSASSTITLDLVGNNVDELIKTSGTVVDSLKGIDGVDKIVSNQEETKPMYNVEVDPSLANAQQIAGQLQMLLNRAPIGTIKVDGKDTPVILQAFEDPTTEGALSKLQVLTEQGPTELSKVAKIVKSSEASSVFRKDSNQYLRINAMVNPDKLSAASAEINKQVTAIKLPDGVKLQQGGASEAQQKEFADMGVTMLASIGIVYLIMVLTFKTLRAPLAILFSLPLAAVGAVIGLVVFQVKVDPSAMIGALMLIGVVVTNAIVLLERVKHNEEHMSIRDALLEAGATRLRPIIMTAVATVCAMLPLLFKGEESGSLVSKSLAVVVIGGLTVSTLLTLVVVPVAYELLHFRKSRKQRREQKASQSLAA
ncbi:efflux RND transporter permease subunit [Paenibacillus sp. MBLB4367]|uniref:efflux RND transporter permease subunit n=1 Tax=Paenibacillus sp. MBLB4367 TaxID=3384767 RepID=UPI0039081272